MAKKSRPTFQKRQKEQARQHKQQAKAARRLEAKQRKANGASEHDEGMLDMLGRPPDPLPSPAANDGATSRKRPCHDQTGGTHDLPSKMHVILTVWHC